MCWPTAFYLKMWHKAAGCLFHYEVADVESHFCQVLYSQKKLQGALRSMWWFGSGSAACIRDLVVSVTTHVYLCRKLERAHLHALPYANMEKPRQGAEQQITPGREQSKHQCQCH